MRLGFPRTLRGRLTVVLAAGSLVLIVALIAGFNVVLRNQIHNDLDSRLRERASAARTNVLVRHGRLVVREAPGDEAIDQQVWVFAARRAVEQPTGTPAADAAAAAASTSPHRFSDAGGLDLRFYTLPVRDGGRMIGAVVTGGSLRPYETTARRALVASVVLGALVLLGVLAAVRLAITAALRPVDRMTAEAAEWSIEDLDHRFGETDTHDELARLAATFNDLLGRLAASFRHEQRFSAEVSHELRTPLAKLIIESELALRRDRTSSEYREALAGVADDARQMQRVVETLLAVARSDVDPRTGTADAGTVAANVVDSVKGPGVTGVEIELHQPEQRLRLGVDADLAERVLAPVVANALQFAAHRTTIDMRAGASSTVEFVVADDGPGVPGDQRELIFNAGYRGQAPARGNGSGAGLGLALARRLARAAGGDVSCGGENGSGAFVISLPGA